MYKAPRDKLVCILNCCKVISNLLVNASLASKEDHPGADEFLPVLIYVTIKVILVSLHIHVLFQDFCVDFGVKSLTINYFNLAVNFKRFY